MIKPFVTSVKDYHDFDGVIRHFKNAGIKLKYKEIGYFNSPLCVGYHAVFYEKVYDVSAKRLYEEYCKIYIDEEIRRSAE